MKDFRNESNSAAAAFSLLESVDSAEVLPSHGEQMQMRRSRRPLKISWGAVVGKVEPGPALSEKHLQVNRP